MGPPEKDPGDGRVAERGGGNEQQRTRQVEAAVLPSWTLRSASEAFRVAQCCAPQRRRWGLSLEAHEALQGPGGATGLFVFYAVLHLNHLKLYRSLPLTYSLKGMPGAFSWVAGLFK